MDSLLLAMAVRGARYTQPTNRDSELHDFILTLGREECRKKEACRHMANRRQNILTR